MDEQCGEVGLGGDLAQDNAVFGLSRGCVSSLAFTALVVHTVRSNTSDSYSESAYTRLLDGAINVGYSALLVTGSCAFRFKGGALGWIGQTVFITVLNPSFSTADMACVK